MKELVRLPPLYTIKELLQLYRINAQRKLSQNFLLDLRLTNKIVKSAGALQDCEVCEIGPGPGSITRSILSKRPRKLIVIEKDVRFKPILEQLASASICPIDIIYADIIDYNLEHVFDKSLKKEWEDSPPAIHLIGNLPFNVSTPLIIRWLWDISLKRSAWSFGRVPMLLTFQEEVAQRITASMFSKARCRMSVMCQIWCHVQHEFSILGKSFFPPPKVNVGVVRFEPFIEPKIPLEFTMIEKVVKTVFNGRQKYCYATASKLFPVELRKDLVERLFGRAEVSPQVRAFQMSMDEWRRLCFAYKEICDENPRIFYYDYRGKRLTRENDWRGEEEDEEEDEEEGEEEFEDEPDHLDCRLK